jgi:hypothetical protein
MRLQPALDGSATGRTAPNILTTAYRASAHAQPRRHHFATTSCRTIWFIQVHTDDTCNISVKHTKPGTVCLCAGCRGCLSVQEFYPFWRFDKQRRPG